jgi:hypothetical protein
MILSIQSCGIAFQVSTAAVQKCSLFSALLTPSVISQIWVKLDDRFFELLPEVLNWIEIR